MAAHYSDKSSDYPCPLLAGFTQLQLLTQCVRREYPQLRTLHNQLNLVVGIRWVLTGCL